ncbi:MAG: hypothetical protein AB1762_18950, partial [Gemmatimonadota bacterium]
LSGSRLDVGRLCATLGGRCVVAVTAPKRAIWRKPDAGNRLVRAHALTPDAVSPNEYSPRAAAGAWRPR